MFPPRSLALKLALFHAFFFSLLTVVSIAVLYNLVRSHTLHEIDAELLKRRDEIALAVQQLSLKDLGTEFNADTEAYGRKDYFIRILTRDGHATVSSDTAAWPGIAVDISRLGGVERNASDFSDLTLPDQRRKARLLLSHLGRDTYLQMGVSLAESENFLRLFQHYAILTLGSMIVLGSLIGWWLARKAMVGVEAVTHAAAGIASGQLGGRVKAAGHGYEIDQLVSTFNRMADRVQAVMGQMRQINDNIAHDLRSPLSRIRGLAEAGVVSGRLDEEGTDLAGSVVEECDRLILMINTMLDISETEAGVNLLNMSDVNLFDLALGVVESFRDLAEEKGVTLNADLTQVPPLSAAPRKLQRMLANLLDNAVKYTPSGGNVRVTLGQEDKDLLLVVEDSGIGIPGDDLPHIFERFYRADQSRHKPGNGLGLSLAQAIAHAHGGEVQVASREGMGSRFTVRLPLSP